METITITLISSEGKVVLKEDVPMEKWERFESKAKELNVTVEELLETVLDDFLRSKGY